MISFTQAFTVDSIYSFGLKLHNVTLTSLLVNVLLVCVLTFCLYFTVKISCLLVAIIVSDFISNVALIYSYGIFLATIKVYLKVSIMCKIFLIIVITVFAITATNFSVLITDRYCIMYSHPKLLYPVHKRCIMALLQVMLCIVSCFTSVLEMATKQIDDGKYLNHSNVDSTIANMFYHLLSPKLHYILPAILIIASYKQIFYDLRLSQRNIPHLMYNPDKNGNVNGYILQLMIHSTVNTINIYPFYASSYIKGIVSKLRLQMKEEWSIMIILCLQLSSIIANIIIFKSSIVVTTRYRPRK